ncbi:class I adenylate-forming enzyme family protein [Leifsonia sp. YAF41]|uniref:class I adenylate-forming enzyme family protein n=1 Tax=Leifsonia sp. YAF41 TaxID=3233086 RepID=UPI003F9EAB50
MPFLDQLQRWADLRPDGSAVEVAGHRLSFRQLRDAATAQLAAGGTRDGITALALPNGTEFVVQFAAAVAGDSSCAVLSPDLPGSVRQTIDQRLNQGATAGGSAVGTPTVARPTPPTLRDGSGDSVFLYGFTSGTTSVPKAFTRTRRSWQLSFETSAAYFGLSDDDRTLAPGPFSASLTLYALCESLFVGAAFIALPRFDVGAALTCLRERGITRLVAVPSALQLIAERDENGPAGSELRSIVSAGSKLTGDTLELLRRWAPNATIFEYFGAAELGFVTAVVHRPASLPETIDRRDVGDHGSADQATAVGMAFPGVEVQIHDDEGAELRLGEIGNIVVRSPLVSDGYAWGDDGAAFRRRGDWCTVGDLGSLDHHRVLHFLGRRADMVTTGGHNVYPHEVEAVLQAVPGVHAALVTGLPDQRRGHRLVAGIRVNDDGADVALLRAECQAALAVPKRPRNYYALTELPLTASGKPSRQLFARWIQDRDPRVIPL